jgi:hypothetical protein
MRTFILSLALSSGALFACYTGPFGEEAAGAPAAEGTNAQMPGEGENMVMPESSEEPVGPDGAPAASGLPCEVEAAVKNSRCLDCHGSPLSAPMKLISYAQLTAPAKSDASKKNAELMVSRMRDNARPMPPSGPRAAASDIDAIAKWVADGYPKGACGVTPPGTPEDPPEPPIVSQCSSKVKTAFTTDRESPEMNPGMACITCHKVENARRRKERAPNLIGGTVYATVREPDLCNGTSEPATVVITDANNQTYSLDVNSVGNFYAWGAELAGIKFPIRAKVVLGGKERAMSTPQMTGDCNSCHTEQGRNGAPGRIFLPK